MGNPFIKPTFNFLDADGIIANHVLTSFSDDIKGKGIVYLLGFIVMRSRKGQVADGWQVTMAVTSSTATTQIKLRTRSGRGRKTLSRRTVYGP